MTKPRFEPDKFIVINRKHIDVYEKNDIEEVPDENGRNPIVNRLFDSLHAFVFGYNKALGRKIGNKYYVCNQDEPYADKVLEIILQGEQDKFESWKFDVFEIVETEMYSLTFDRDEDEKLMEHFKTGISARDFVKFNSIPW
jgi:hypothetical protein